MQSETVLIASNSQNETAVKNHENNCKFAQDKSKGWFRT